MTTIDLTDTNASAVSSALVSARRAAGNQAVGMVLTLIVVVDEATHYDALRSARDAGREHPSRILVVITRPGRGQAAARRRDPGGRRPAGRHDRAPAARRARQARRLGRAAAAAPRHPGRRVVARRRRRRCPARTSSARSPSAGSPTPRPRPQPMRALHQRAESYPPGDTDLAWTRLTPWRALLAAALDQLPGSTVTAATVEAERGNPSADILASWLSGAPRRRGHPHGVARARASRWSR